MNDHLRELCAAAFQTLERLAPRFPKPWTAALAAGLVGTGAAAAATNWPVENATVRFEVQLVASPNEPEAGVIAVIPDGGLLPRSAPDPVVIDTQGKTLKSEVLWYNPRDGIAVVFEQPAQGLATIYFRPSGTFTRVGNKPGSFFKPGLMLVGKQGHASMPAALSLPQEALQGGTRLGFVPFIGQRENQLGQNEDFTAYYSGWVRMASKTKTFICTISSDGSMAQVDGKVVANWPGIHKRTEGGSGKYGSWVELAAGPHRVEYFYFKKGNDEAEANLCWKLPSDKLPHTIRATDYFQSGQARVLKCELADGATPAAIRWVCSSYLWLRSWPWCNFTLQALGAAQAPAGTTYTWEPEPGLRVNGPELNWLFAGQGEHSVGLTVTQGATVRKSQRTVYFARTPQRATINSPNDRVEYRKALLARCQAVPAAQRPCATWDDELWTIFSETAEPLAGLSVMQEVFERSWSDLQRRPPAERYRLENIYFELMRYSDKKQAEGWLPKFESADGTNRERRLLWQMTKVDFTLNELNQPEEARKLAAAFRATAAGSNEIALVMIRQGDVERYAGQAEDAAKFYSGAQDILGKKSGTLAKGAMIGNPAQKGKPAKDERLPKWQQRGGKGERLFAIAPSVDDWRKQAVREAAYYETLHTMLKVHDVEEARKTLAQWELEFPLSKLAGDYPIGEGEFYTSIGDFNRALRVLSTYRKNVEISNYLPQAMALECRCLHALKRLEEFKTLAAELIKRFPGHPAATEMQTELDIAQGRRSNTPGLRLEDFQ
jgi:TolA-binding protein